MRVGDVQAQGMAVPVVSTMTMVRGPSVAASSVAHWRGPCLGPRRIVRRAALTQAETDVVQLGASRLFRVVEVLRVEDDRLAFTSFVAQVEPRLRRALGVGLSPVTWLGYWLHTPSGKGTETASSWQKPK